MGYNSVAVILNDALHAIVEDPSIGAAIGVAVHGYGSPKRYASEATAYTKNGGAHVSAIKIIGQEHSSLYQTIVVGKNTGWSLIRDRDIPNEAIEAVAESLRARGYRVTKPKRPAGD